MGWACYTTFGLDSLAPRMRDSIGIELENEAWVEELAKGDVLSYDEQLETATSMDIEAHSP